MFCEWNDERTKCIHCGIKKTRGDIRNCMKNGSLPPPPRLGDYTESVLNSLGISKERYKAAKELFGLAPNCGCDERKEWLNKVSDWWRGEATNPPT